MFLQLHLDPDGSVSCVGVPSQMLTKVELLSSEDLIWKLLAGMFPPASPRSKVQKCSGRIRHHFQRACLKS